MPWLKLERSPHFSGGLLLLNEKIAYAFTKYVDFGLISIERKSVMKASCHYKTRLFFEEQSIPG